jgi:hypothetical protein
MMMVRLIAAFEANQLSAPSLQPRNPCEEAPMCQPTKDAVALRGLV